MSVTIVSEPDRWIKKPLTKVNMFSKIFSVQALSEAEVAEWARTHALKDSMTSQGKDPTTFTIQKVGALYAVHFYWESSK
jgi:hypothetical protein